MIELCQMCGDAKLVQGPRNQKVLGLCSRQGCRIKALMLLAHDDLISREEADELSQALGG